MTIGKIPHGIYKHLIQINLVDQVLPFSLGLEDVDYSDLFSVQYETLVLPEAMLVYTVT